MSTLPKLELSRYKHEFANLGTQYYVAGRLSALAGHMPVCGNLMHHAIELYVKADLVSRVSLSDLKFKYSHKLWKLWEERKAHDTTLATHDETIKQLDAFDSIRYPEKIIGNGGSMTVGFGRQAGPPSKPGSPYLLVVNDIDVLVVELLDRMSVNPRVLPCLLLRLHTQPAIMHANPHADRWREWLGPCNAAAAELLGS